MTKSEIAVLKQQYATPWAFIDWVKENVLRPRGISQFGIDVCASKTNTKAHEWYDEDADGLICDWTNTANAAAWCNPPFKDVTPWLRKARTEASCSGIFSCVLTHMDHSTDWFRIGMSRATEVILINPRINFVQHADLLKYMKENNIKPGGNDKQNALWVFDPDDLPRLGEKAIITYPKPWRQCNGKR